MTADHNNNEFVIHSTPGIRCRNFTSIFTVITTTEDYKINLIMVDYGETNVTKTQRKQIQNNNIWKNDML